MTAIPNSREPLKKVNISDDKDRIGSLPDAILVHILSFLPTKDAVGTSILSRRWKHLWASVPNLNFEDVPNINFEDQLLFLPEIHNVIPFSFMNFVDKVLLLHDLPCISKFRLTCVREIDSYRLNAWICTAIKRLVRELDIRVSLDCRVYLTQSFCTCKTLVVLRLGYKLVLGIPTSVWFPSLKILDISILYPNDVLMQKLFCSCPVLENLTIEGFLGEDTEIIFNVSVPTLKRLSIDLPSEEVEEFRYTIVLDTPSLEYLDVYDALLGCYSVKNLSSLVKAQVDIGYRCVIYKICNHGNHANRIHDLLRGFSNVKSLWLSYSVLYFADDYKLPMLYNLTRLELNLCARNGWKQLPNLLESMPNLEILALNNFPDDGFIKESNLVLPQEVPRCLLLHLKEIEITRFLGWKEEVKLLKYLLKNGEVLNKVTIHSLHISSYVEDKRKARGELLMFPRGSKTCQIEFS